MNTPDNMYLQFQKVDFHYDIHCNWFRLDAL